MKKFAAVCLSFMLLLSLTACGAKDDTLGGMLKNDFTESVEKNENISAQELADRICANENIPFEMVSMPVEPGVLMGFNEIEITGFKEAVQFSPMIGTVPFLGYIFVLEDETDVNDFIDILTANANPRWNICTEAEETMVTSVGNHVFFLMSPKDTDLV